MTDAFQDYYAQDFNQCYGCGSDNPAGHQLKSYWVKDNADQTTIAHFKPDTKYSAGNKDSVYGGMIASLMDCHGTGSAAAFLYREHGRKMGDSGKPIRCVTASLKVNFLKPTPMGEVLEIRGTLRSIEGRKVWVDLTVSANKKVCATGEILAIALKPE